MWKYMNIMRLRSRRIRIPQQLQLLVTTLSRSSSQSQKEEFSPFGSALVPLSLVAATATAASVGLVTTTLEISDDTPTPSLSYQYDGNNSQRLNENEDGFLGRGRSSKFWTKSISHCEGDGDGDGKKESSQSQSRKDDDGIDKGRGGSGLGDKADPSFHENSAAITFRRRRLSLNVAKDIQPVTQKDEYEGNAESQNSRRFNGNRRRRYPKHRIMYSSEFDHEQGSENGHDRGTATAVATSDNMSSKFIPPFPSHQVGTYSCHGVEPHPFIVYDEADLDSDTYSFFQKLFGSSPQSEVHRPARVVTVSKKKINQDRGHVIYPYVAINGKGNKNSNYSNINNTHTALFGAYDGHGERGELLAEYTMRAVSDKLHLHPNFPNSPHSNNNSKSDVPKAFRDVFLQIDDEIQHEKHLRPMSSGSTACVALLQGKNLWVANVGDSRAVLGRRVKTNAGAGRGGKNNIDARSNSNSKHSNGHSSYTYSAIDLSKDQNAHDENERDRIIKAGGYITIPEDESYAARIWADEACTQIGLAMSRSIGDHSLKHVGVTADPVVEQYELTDNDEFLVIATDGVWEFISSEGAVDIIQRCFREGMGASEASAFLIRVAMNKWKEKEGDYRDDITAIVVRLDGIWENASNE